MKIAIVTGVSSKIGKALCRLLIGQGYELILVNRPGMRFDNAVSELRTELKAEFKSEYREQMLHAFSLDLSDPEAIERFIESITESGVRIQALFHNAGVISQKKCIQKQGCEVTVMVNAVAPWLLTMGLAPLLAKDAQIVVSGSAASRMVSKLDLENFLNPEVYLPMKTAYAPSKAAVKLYMAELQAKHPTWRVSVVDLMPTNSAMAQNNAMPFLIRKFSFLFSSAHKTAKRLLNAERELTVNKKLSSQRDALIKKTERVFSHHLVNSGESEVHSID